MTHYDVRDYARRPGLPVEPFGNGTRCDDRLERLLQRLPERWRRLLNWLLQPSLWWARIPAGVLLIIGSVLSVLPFFGLWMLPLGLFLLAEDVPPLRRMRARTLEWLERYRPDWFGGNGESSRRDLSDNEGERK